jgi:hypothetical protein
MEWPALSNLILMLITAKQIGRMTVGNSNCNLGFKAVKSLTDGCIIFLPDIRKFLSGYMALYLRVT